MKRFIAASMLMLAALTGHGAPDWPIPSEMKTVDVGGYPLAYVEAGTGVPFLIVHGAWVDHRLFAAQVAEFSKAFRVIAVSLRHHWPEPWDGKAGDYTVEQHAADLVALVQRLDLGKVHVLGHSRGGGVAAAMGRRAPEVVRSLILAEPSGMAEVAADPTVVRQRMAAGNAMTKQLKTGWESGTPREQLAARAWEAGNCAGSWERMPPPIRQMIADNIVTMTAPMIGSDPPIATCEQVGAWRMPVMLVQSSRPAPFFADILDGLRRCNSAIAPAVVVPDSTHNMHLGNPAFFNRVVLDFARAN